MFTSVRYKVATADYSVTILIRVKAHGEVKVSQLFPRAFRCISFRFVLDIPNDPSRQDRWTGREVVVQALDQC